MYTSKWVRNYLVTNTSTDIITLLGAVLATIFIHHPPHFFLLNIFYFFCSKTQIKNKKWVLSTPRNKPSFEIPLLDLRLFLASSKTSKFSRFSHFLSLSKNGFFFLKNQRKKKSAKQTASAVPQQSLKLTSLIVLF